MQLKKMFVGSLALALVFGAMALQVDVVKQGAAKVTVTLQVSGSPEYQKILRRNLERSGWFRIGPSGSITVSGAAGGAVTARGRGKSITSRESFADADKVGAHMAARRFADAIVEAFSDGGKGFATKRIACVDRKGTNNGELYTCYPDGEDMKRYVLSETNKCAVIGPRWTPDGKELYFTSFLDAKQLVYRLIVDANAPLKCLGFFAGGASNAAVSPDGRSVALTLCYQGNPELYVMDFASRRIQRMTNTPAAAESSPCWSPDGRKIAYVSDQTRNPQIYICDVASRQSTRYTSKGRQNTHPDWAKNGRLCWSSLQAGQWCVMASEPNGGEASARMVTQPGTWQDPSWAADGRHLVASRDKALFLVDTEPDGDKPVQLFYNKGNWMNPAFSK